jgi:hypothetical protein
VLLFQMMTGSLPFDGESMGEVLVKQVTQLPPAPRGLNPSIPPSVEQVLLRCLAKPVGARFQSMQELRAALLDPEAYLRSAPPIAPARSVAPGEAKVDAKTVMAHAAMLQAQKEAQNDAMKAAGVSKKGGRDEVRKEAYELGKESKAASKFTTESAEKAQKDGAEAATKAAKEAEEKELAEKAQKEAMTKDPAKFGVQPHSMIHHLVVSTQGTADSLVAVLSAGTPWDSVCARFAPGEREREACRHAFSIADDTPDSLLVTRLRELAPGGAYVRHEQDGRMFRVVQLIERNPLRIRPFEEVRLGGFSRELVAGDDLPAVARCANRPSSTSPSSATDPSGRCWRTCSARPASTSS